MRSTCMRYRIDSNLSHGKRVYVVWFYGMREPERLGEWPSVAEAKEASDTHANAMAAVAEREWSKWSEEAR